MNEIIEVLKEELGLTKKQIKEILENEDKLGNPDIIPIIEKTIELTRQRIIEMIDKRIEELSNKKYHVFYNLGEQGKEFKKPYKPEYHKAGTIGCCENCCIIKELQDLKRKVEKCQGQGSPAKW